MGISIRCAGFRSNSQDRLHMDVCKIQSKADPANPAEEVLSCVGDLPLMGMATSFHRVDETNFVQSLQPSEPSGLRGARPLFCSCTRLRKFLMRSQGGLTECLGSVPDFVTA